MYSFTSLFLISLSVSGKPFSTIKDILLDYVPRLHPLWLYTGGKAK